MRRLRGGEVLERPRLLPALQGAGEILVECEKCGEMVSEVDDWGRCEDCAREYREFSADRDDEPKNNLQSTP
jgi:hypothetical protein